MKEAHETLYHFHEPETEAQANEWLMRYLLRYNDQPHRHEDHSRMHDWLTHLPAEGVRARCTWERFCRFAREPEQRKVGPDARVSIDGALYEVVPDMAGECRHAAGGPVRRRAVRRVRRKTQRTLSADLRADPAASLPRLQAGKVAETADRIRALAEQLQLPISALAGSDVRMADASAPIPVPTQPFEMGAHDDDFSSTVAAKLAIAEDLAVPLAKLSVEDRGFIDEVLAQTLSRGIVLARIRDYFRHKRSGEEHHAR